MKCYDHTTRGILVADNALASLKTPVIFTESLLKAPQATFVDRLVFADVEVADDKIFLSAQKDPADNRALVLHCASEGVSEDYDDQISYEMEFNRAEVPYLKREHEYGGWGYEYHNQRTVLVLEPGGHVLIKVKRITESRVGLWARLFGAKPVTQEILKHIQVRYDGNEVTVQIMLQEQREIARLASAAPEARQLLA